MVSQKPHGTIEYTVSTGVWFVSACWKWGCWGWKGATGTNQEALSGSWLQFVPVSVGIAANTMVRGEQAHVLNRCSAKVFCLFSQLPVLFSLLHHALKSNHFIIQEHNSIPQRCSGRWVVVLCLIPRWCEGSFCKPEQRSSVLLWWLRGLAVPRRALCELARTWNRGCTHTPMQRDCGSQVSWLGAPQTPDMLQWLEVAWPFECGSFPHLTDSSE